MNPEIDFFHGGVGPRPSDEFFLGDEVARPLNERKQDFERTATYSNRLVGFQQHSLGRKKVKGPEQERADALMIGPVSHVVRRQIVKLSLEQ